MNRQTLRSGALGGMLGGAMMATLLGVMFAVLASRYSATRTTLLGAGMIYGVVVWLLMQYILWPLVDDAAAQAFTARVFAVGHLLFGMVTAIVVAPALAAGALHPERTA